MGNLALLQRILQRPHHMLLPHHLVKILWSIFSIVKEEIATDLTTEDARNLWLVSNQVGVDEIETLSIDVASGLVVPKTVQISGGAAYTLVAKDEPFDYKRVQEAIANFIGN